MTVSAPLLFPGSRTLAGWWKQLAPVLPATLWFGHLVLHRVEALARVNRPCRLDGFTQLLLQALGSGPPLDLDRLDARLHLGRQVLHQVVRHLQHEGLARPDGTAGWALTELGERALAHGAYPRAVFERRTFHFIEAEHGPPHFLSVSATAGIPWSPGEDWQFDPGLLEACLKQPPDWKQRHAFPAELEEILTLGPPAPAQANGPPPWQRVILDRPERLPAVLVLQRAEDGSERLLGFGVQVDGWSVQTTRPVFALGDGWREPFPDLAQEPPLAVWREAWQAWCRPRSLPPAEVEACTLERQGCHLRVSASPRLIDRLRSARSDVFKGEAWVLAGSGRVRPAALVELVEAGKVAARG